MWWKDLVKEGEEGAEWTKNHWKKAQRWVRSAEAERSTGHLDVEMKSSVKCSKEIRESKPEGSGMDWASMLSRVLSLLLLPIFPSSIFSIVGGESRTRREKASLWPSLNFFFFFFCLVQKRPWTLQPHAKSLNFCVSQSPYPKLELYQHPSLLLER